MERIDRTSSAFGKRVLKERLLNPICDKDELESRYDLIEKLSKDSELYVGYLKQVYDLERILRRIKLKKLHPVELSYIVISLESIEKIITLSQKNSINTEETLLANIKEFHTMLLNTFNINICAKFKIEQIDENIFKKGVYPNIDLLVKSQEKELDKIHQVAKFIESLFEGTKIQRNSQLIQVAYMESEGYYLSLIKVDLELLKKGLKTHLK